MLASVAQLTASPHPSGKDLAQLASLVCVANVMKAFHLELPAGHPEVGTVTKFTQDLDKDINIVFTKRDA